MSKAYIKAPNGGLRMAIDPTRFPRAGHNMTLTERIAHIDAARARLEARQHRFHVVLGTMLGTLLGFSIALAVFRINGVL